MANFVLTYQQIAELDFVLSLPEEGRTNRYLLNDDNLRQLAESLTGIVSIPKRLLSIEEGDLFALLHPKKVQSVWTRVIRKLGSKAMLAIPHS